MRKLLRTLPNQITALRLLAVPVLWILALSGQTRAVGFGLAFCGLSDWLDGVIARRLNQVSPGGARFDSQVDHLLLVSTAAWVVMLKSELFRDHPIAVAVALGVYLLSMAVGIVKFRQIGNLHLRLSRLTAYMLYALLIHTFLAPRYSPLLFWVTWLMWTLSSTETLLLQLICSEVDESMVSLLHVLRQRRNNGARAPGATHLRTR